MGRGGSKNFITVIPQSPESSRSKLAANQIGSKQTDKIRTIALKNYDCQQVFSGQMPKQELLKPIKNISHAKPQGGLWTSTASVTGSLWSDLISEDGYYSLGEASDKQWSLQVNQDARIIEVRDLADFKQLTQNYPPPEFDLGLDEERMRLLRQGGMSCAVDWEKLSKDYDGLFVRQKAIYQRDSDTGSLLSPLSTWDIESTVWFRFAFEELKDIK